MTNTQGSLWDGNICTANIGSMTFAQKAQRALQAQAIQSAVTKISSKNTSRGCSYGVRFPCTQLGNVKIILSKENITVKEFL